MPEIKLHSNWTHACTVRYTHTRTDTHKHKLKITVIIAKKLNSVDSYFVFRHTKNIKIKFTILISFIYFSFFFWNIEDLFYFPCSCTAYICKCVCMCGCLKAIVLMIFITRWLRRSLCNHFHTFRPIKNIDNFLLFSDALKFIC